MLSLVEVENYRATIMGSLEVRWGQGRLKVRRCSIDLERAARLPRYRTATASPRLVQLKRKDKYERDMW